MATPNANNRIINIPCINSDESCDNSEIVSSENSDIPSSFSVGTISDFSSESNGHDFIGSGTFGNVKRCDGHACKYFSSFADFIRELNASYFVGLLPNCIRAVNYDCEKMTIVYPRYEMDLADWIKVNRYHASDEVKLNIILQINDGLLGLYDNGLIHGDLKPHNILLNSQSLQLVLADYGNLGQPHYTKHSLGTNFYRAVQEGPLSNNYDRAYYKTDMYAFAIIMLELWVELDYRHAYHAGELAILSKGCPAKVSHIIKQCLKKVGIRFNPENIRHYLQNRSDDVCITFNMDIELNNRGHAVQLCQINKWLRFNGTFYGIDNMERVILANMYWLEQYDNDPTLSSAIADYSGHSATGTNYVGSSNRRLSSNSVISTNYYLIAGALLFIFANLATRNHTLLDDILLGINDANKYNGYTVTRNTLRDLICQMSSNARIGHFMYIGY